MLGTELQNSRLLLVAATPATAAADDDDMEDAVQSAAPTKKRSMADLIRDEDDRVARRKADRAYNVDTDSVLGTSGLSAASSAGSAAPIAGSSAPPSAGSAEPPSWLKVGASVSYLRPGGLSTPAVVRALHTDDPPAVYCTIAITSSDGGASSERQTPLHRLRPQSAVPTRSSADAPRARKAAAGRDDEAEVAGEEEKKGEVVDKGGVFGRASDEPIMLDESQSQEDEDPQYKVLRDTTSAKRATSEVPIELLSDDDDDDTIDTNDKEGGGDKLAAKVDPSDGAEAGGSAVQIVIDLLDSDDDDDDDDGDLKAEADGAGSSAVGGGEPTVIDLETLDDTSLARKLNKLHRGGGERGGGDAGGSGSASAGAGGDVIDLDALQAAAEARRARLRERRAASGEGSSRGEMEAIDVEDEAASDLLHAQRENIETFLKVRAAQYQITELWHNPASRPGGKLYERFFGAWSEAPSRRLRMVFHGTAEANVDAICRDGLDPSRRGTGTGQAYGPGARDRPPARRACACAPATAHSRVRVCAHPPSRVRVRPCARRVLWGQRVDEPRLLQGRA